MPSQFWLKLYSFASAMRSRLLTALFTTLLFATGSLASMGGESPALQHKVKIVLVGDSTVTDKSGWGLGFKAYLQDGAECINTAMGGRSSKSFMDEGRWTNALALHGDYYLIQFGHNNEPGKPGRSTDMVTFISNLETYVYQARAIGAKPILITPLTRRQWDKTNEAKIKSSLKPYAETVEKLAAEKKVPVLDLHSRSIELCEQLGKAGCASFSPLKEVDATNALDNTHLNAEGSVLFAGLVVAEIRKAAPDLASYLRSEVKPMPQTGDHDGAASLVDSKAKAVEMENHRRVSSANERPGDTVR